MFVYYRVIKYKCSYSGLWQCSVQKTTNNMNIDKNKVVNQMYGNNCVEGELTK